MLCWRFGLAYYVYFHWVNWSLHGWLVGEKAGGVKYVQEL